MRSTPAAHRDTWGVRRRRDRRDDEDLADEIEGLLRPCRDEHIVDRDGDAVAAGMARNQLPQRTLAFGRAVLQRLAPMLAKNTPARLLESVDGKQVGGRQAPGKRDQVRLGGELEQLADQRAAHRLRAPRVTVGPSSLHRQSSLAQPADRP
jgi:hypothetical protein